jgi:anaerobic ribonucleoside-triphosphate reductase
MYINDMHFMGAGIPYCFNYSCNDVAQSGLPMINKIKSVAPKYLYSFKSQLEQFVIIAANNTAGATGLADIFLTMSMYINKILKTGRDAHFYFEG